MRCTKSGQLAAVNWPQSTVHNHIVTTSTLIAKDTHFDFCGRRYCTKDGPAWWVKTPSPVPTLLGPLSTFPIYDHHLRPIADPDSGGVEQNTFQGSLPTVAESIATAVARLHYGSQS